MPCGIRCLLVCFLLISLTVSGVLAHIIVGVFFAVSEATVVPHEPPPSKPTLRFILYVFDDVRFKRVCFGVI